MPDLSVIIPTHARPDRLEACLQGLARQSLDPGSFEVLVGVDGGATSEASLLDMLPCRATCLEFEQRGPAAVRNDLIARADSPWLLILNDDVVPAPNCLEAHLAAQRTSREADAPALVLGSAPWRVHEPDSLFTRLIRETSMIFFYDRMNAIDRNRDWGFRHAWTLNLSVETRLARVGFDADLPCACFEDLEWAWRVTRTHGCPVLYRPEAVVVHDHAYEPEGYLTRERMLGAQALHLSHAAPECARDIFGRDVGSDEELEYSEAFVEREQPLAETLRASFNSLAMRDPDVPADLIPLLYEHHLPLKRWMWRTGLCSVPQTAVTRGL